MADSDKTRLIDKSDSISEEKTFSFFFDSAGYKVFKKGLSKILNLLSRKAEVSNCEGLYQTAY